LDVFLKAFIELHLACNCDAREHCWMTKTGFKMHTNHLHHWRW